jgi:hypothetical protein
MAGDFLDTTLVFTLLVRSPPQSTLARDVRDPVLGLPDYQCLLAGTTTNDDEGGF